MNFLAIVSDKNFHSISPPDSHSQASKMLLQPLVTLLALCSTAHAAGTWVGVLDLSVGGSVGYKDTRIAPNGEFPAKRARVGFSDGCKNDPIPEWQVLCLDYARRRGHFITEIGNRYCVRAAERQTPCSDCDGVGACFCTWRRYDEVRCTW